MDAASDRPIQRRQYLLGVAGDTVDIHPVWVDDAWGNKHFCIRIEGDHAATVGAYVTQCCGQAPGDQMYVSKKFCQAQGWDIQIVKVHLDSVLVGLGLAGVTSCGPGVDSYATTGWVVYP